MRTRWPAPPRVSSAGTRPGLDVRAAGGHACVVFLVRSPAPALAPFVAGYWFVQDLPGAHEGRPIRTSPHPGAVLSVNIGRPNAVEGGPLVPGASLLGVQTAARGWRSWSDTYFVMAMLTVRGLARLFPHTGHGSADTLLDLGAMLGDAASHALAADVGAGDEVDHVTGEVGLGRVHVDDHAAAARGEQAPQALERLLPAREGGQAEEDVQAIDRDRTTGGAGERGVVDRVHVLPAQDHLGVAALLGPRRGAAQHAGAEVDADDQALGADRGREAVEALAGAARQVEHDLAGCGVAGRGAAGVAVGRSCGGCRRPRWWTFACTRRRCKQYSRRRGFR